MIVSTVAARKIDLWIIDIGLAYTRSGHITRDVYVRTDAAFALPSHIVFQIVQTVYGLPDAGGAW